MDPGSALRLSGVTAERRCRPLLAAVLALALAACGSEFRERVGIADSRYDREVTVSGIERPYGSTKVSFKTYYLRSFVDKQSLAARHQLYVGGLDVRPWDAANDEDARPLEFTAVDARRGRMDDFGAMIPEDTLRARRLFGYGVKFYAKDGATAVVRLSPEQIGAQLDAVEAVRLRLSGSGAATSRPAPAASAPPTGSAARR